MILHKFWAVTVGFSLGTSNWSGDYFINTGGVGVIIKPSSSHTKKSLRDQLQAVFDRDWSSDHAIDIFKFKP